MTPSQYLLISPWLAFNLRVLGLQVFSLETFAGMCEQVEMLTRGFENVSKHQRGGERVMDLTESSSILRVTSGSRDHLSLEPRGMPYC